MPMNNLCSCTGVSASKLDHPKQQVISNSCKVCGGKPLIDGQEASPAKMLSNIGLEFHGVISPHLNWRTACKGKPRAVRRARTSFTSTIKQNSLERGPKKTENLLKKEANKSREMPVSESEKLGVTILGHRFSETFENVPIKKRRFLFRSPSPPSCSQFIGDGPGHSLVSHAPTSHTRKAANLHFKGSRLKISPAHKKEVDSRSINNENSKIDNMGEQLCDAADFSGISILAAAACNSSSADDVMKTEELYHEESSKGGEPVEIFESLSVSENEVTEGKEPEKVTALDNDMDATLDSTFNSKLSCMEDDNKMDNSCSKEDSSSSLLTVLDKDYGIKQGAGPLRDGRFHWDLNTVMESWESPDDVVTSEPVGGSETHSGKAVKQENFQGDNLKHSVESIGKSADKAVDLGRQLFSEDKRESCIVFGSTCHTAIPECNNDSEQHVEDCFPLEGALLLEQTNAFVTDQGPIINKDTGCSHVGYASDTVRDSPSANSYPSEEHGICTSHLTVKSVGEIGNGVDSQVDNSAEDLICVSVDEFSNDNVLNEKAFVESEVGLVKATDACVSADVDTGKSVLEEEVAFEHPDEDMGKVLECSVRPAAKQISDISIDREQCKMSADDDSCGGLGPIEPFCEEKSGVIFQSDKSYNGTCLSKSIALLSHHLSNHEENSGGCMSEVKELNTKMITLQGVQASLTDRGGDDMVLNQHAYESNAIIEPNVIDAHLNDAPNANDICYKESGTNSPVVNALDDHFDCDYYSDVSQNELASAMEKAEHLAEDDTQYEDGEFRESVVHSWEMDGCDDGEAEHVDYGSDNREIDGFEAVSGYPVPNTPFHDVSPQEAQCKNEGPIKDTLGKGDNNSNIVRAESRDLPSSVANVSDLERIDEGFTGIMKKGPSVSGSGRTDISKKWENTTDAMEGSMPVDNLVEHVGVVAQDDDMREQDCPTNLRMKSSGWDRLPETHKSSGEIVVDPGADISLVECDNAPENLKTIGSTVRRESSSLLDKPKSPDIMPRKDRAFFRGTRNRYSHLMHHGGKRDIELGRSNRRDETSVHGSCRGRGDRWIESPSYHGPNCRGSPGYYSHAGFAHSSTKNAAAVSIAKVESNGFVVAPDGTVLEASGIGHLGHISRRSANPSSNVRNTLRQRSSPIKRDETLSLNESRLDVEPRRQLSPGRPITIGHGRPGRYGPKIANDGNAERYNSFTPTDGLGSSMLVHHSCSRQDRSFSPQTRSVQVSRSHTRSHSQSRNQSPHGWTSPRRRNLINNGSRRRTSPPDFRTNARVGRARSPHGQSGFAESTSFCQSPRSHTSPPHATRWIERKGLIENFRGDGYRRFSGRSPPKRLLTRSHRFDPIDSSGRPKADELYRSTHSGRFTDFNSGNVSRQGNDNGDRRHMDQYEIPPARQYDILGDAKQLRYETVEGYRLRNDHSKNELDFLEQGSPRSFDRGKANQPNNSPPRTKEEMSQFRYRRDGKHKTSYKTFECDDEALRRRRHS